MNYIQIYLIISLVCAASPALAAAPDLTKLPPAAAREGVTYAKDIRPMLEASCFRCHGQQRQRGGLRLDSLEAVLKGGEDGKVIIPGKSTQSHLVLAVAQLDPETAMPPKPGGGQGGGRGRNAGQGGGRAAGGPNAAGPGRAQGGFGRGVLAQMMVAQADKDNDQKLTKGEFSALAEVWYDKLDSAKSGKLDQNQFSERLGKLLLPAQATAAGGEGQRAGNRAGGGGSAAIFTGLFTAADADKSGSLTRTEFHGAFEKWFAEWDSEKTGALNEEKLYAGLRAILPQQNFGGQGGPGGGGGQGGPGGGGGGGAGPAPKPLTAEQVGLVRAWVDQGAK